MKINVQYLFEEKSNIQASKIVKMRWDTNISDYLRGKQTGKSANRLERKALSDPFLYEALEGLAGQEEDADVVLGILERRLQQRLRRSRRPLYKWLVAASFLLIGGIAVLLLQMKPEISEVPVISKQEGLLPPISEAQEESTVILENINPADTPVLMAKKEIVLSLGLSTGNNRKKENTIASMEFDDTRAISVVSNSLKSEINDSAVLPDSGEVKVEESPFVLEEAVVIRYNPEKKMVLLGAVKMDRSKKRSYVIPIPISSGDIEKFDRYVVDSLRYPEDAARRGIEGDVELSFRTDKRGQAIRIKVVKNLIRSCDKEAIRLLAQYQEWTHTDRSERVLITIRFRLNEK